MTDRLRFLMALCLVALEAAAFAIAFRSSLTLWYVTLLLVAKVFATGASVASGVPGCIFTPPCC